MFSASLQREILFWIVYTHHFPFLASDSSLSPIQVGLHPCQSTEIGSYEGY